MKSRWSESEAERFVARYGPEHGDDLALRVYTSRLIGSEKELVLYGGGNTSVKGEFGDVLGRRLPAVYVKASGHRLGAIEPRGFAPLDLEYLRLLRDLTDLSDEAMVDQFKTHLFDSGSAAPSIETLMHAFFTPKFIDHTHADSILALTNLPDGAETVREALGGNVIILDYARPGFALAKAAAAAFDSSPQSDGMVLIKHGLVTWGETARESYDRTIDIVTRAEKYLAASAGKRPKAKAETSIETARKRYLSIAPVLRGLLAVPTGDSDSPHQRFILRPLISDRVRELVDSKAGRDLALTPPLTADHLVRTKPFPLWIDSPSYDDLDRFRDQAGQAIADYSRRYEAYVNRHSAELKPGLIRFDSRPRVIFLAGLGAVCAAIDVHEADLVADITARTADVKLKAAPLGAFEGLSEEHLFDMEYFTLQHAKLDRTPEPPLKRSVAVVTGAAGAIGSGICFELLDQGCHVAATDLPGDRLDSFAAELKEKYGNRAVALPMDVTDPESVASAFDSVIETWGGIDIVVANAGAAHVSSLETMNLDSFRRLERVNVEGTLNLVSAAAAHFRVQGTGGDVVLISTKNVFAPGPGFGAYSATKAAAHQLARIASIELAEIGVRVNMVSPDAVFGEGKHRSGLWAEVGPNRMKVRGLDEKGLEEYYRNRNLLKAKITPEHVARAVLFFVTRRTPTTGATIPVDGGLPDSAPR